MLEKKDIEQLCQIAVKAGEKVMEIYNDEKFSKVVDVKDDNSPLTLADKASHQYIQQKLEEHYPQIPIISEEGEQQDYEVRKDYEYFWLVDPLDGTKEFIRRNGQFTVNIALMNRNKPVFGVIYAPVPQELYYGGGQYGAYKIEEEGVVYPIKVNGNRGNRIAVRSRSHASPEEEGILEKYDVVDGVSTGSSLKFCYVAEGKADLYYRHGPTMEWDTAAGQAIVEAAGGRMYKGDVEEKIFYYNKESLLNSGFLCLGW